MHGREDFSFEQASKMHGREDHSFEHKYFEDHF